MSEPRPARRLVVDDILANRELLERRPRRFGHEVAVAEGGLLGALLDPVDGRLAGVEPWDDVTMLHVRRQA